MACNGGAPGLLQIGDTMTRRISNVLSNGVSVNSNFPSPVALSSRIIINFESYQLQKCFNWNVKNNFRWDCRSILDDGSPMCIVRIPPPKKKVPHSKDPLRLIKSFFLYLVLCTCSFLFISQSAKNRSGSNICVTSSRRSATSSRGNSYDLSSRTPVDG